MIKSMILYNRKTLHQHLLSVYFISYPMEENLIYDTLFNSQHINICVGRPTLQIRVSVLRKVIRLVYADISSNFSTK